MGCGGSAGTVQHVEIGTISAVRTTARNNNQSTKTRIVGKAPNAFFTKVSTASMETSEFEIWCFNLRTEFKDKDDGPNGWTYRRSACAQFIQARQPLLVCVQEATAEMLDFLASNIGKDQYSWIGTSRSLKTGDEMAGFLYNKQYMDLVCHHTLWLAPDNTPRGSPGWDAMYPRTLETAVFRYSTYGPTGILKEQPIGMLRVLNAHLDHVGTAARKCSAELIAKTIATGVLEWPQCVQIVTGDFNSIKANNDCYDILAQIETGLLDTAREVPRRLLDVTPFTLHKFEGLDFDASKGDGSVVLDVAGNNEPDAQHIDWVFFRNGSALQVKPVKYQVMTDRVLPNGPYLSDHFPVSVTFEVRQRTFSKNAVFHESQLNSDNPSDGQVLKVQKVDTPQQQFPEQSMGA